MLDYNQRLNVIFSEAKIITARHQNAFVSLHGAIPPKNDEEQREINRRKALLTYDEVKKTGTRTPYKDFIRQF